MFGVNSLWSLEMWAHSTNAVLLSIGLVAVLIYVWITPDKAPAEGEDVDG